MPAAARKRYPSVVPDERAYSAPRHAPQRHAGGRPLRNPNTRYAPTTAAAPAANWQASALTASAQRQLDERANPVYESSLDSSAKARNARRRARRRHRPFRLTWQAGIAGCILMGQLVVLLWMQGVALSARNRSFKLDKDIADKYSAVTQTQKEIAGLDSASRIATWATARGWQVASQDKLDSVNNLTPVTANDMAQAAPVAPAPAGVSGKHDSHKAHRYHQQTPVETSSAQGLEVAKNDADIRGDLPAASQTTSNDSAGSSAHSTNAPSNEAGDD